MLGTMTLADYARKAVRAGQGRAEGQRQAAITSPVNYGISHSPA